MGSRRIRWGWIIGGVAVALAGLATLGGGLVIRFAGDVVAVATSEAHGTTGSPPITFTARDRRYEIVYDGVPSRALRVRDARCNVRLADRRLIAVTGRGEQPIDAGFTKIGAFRGVAGPTRIACGFTERFADVRIGFSVTRTRNVVRRAGGTLVVIGIVLIVVGALLTAYGVAVPKRAPETGPFG